MKSPTKSPAFQFYPGDFLSSPDVQLMTSAEVGAYLLLLLSAWVSKPQGFLANDEDRLRRISRLTSKQWSESRTLLLKKFPESEDSTLRYNPRLLLELEKQLKYRQTMQTNGLMGGRPPKAENQKVILENPKVSKRKADGNPNITSSSSSSSSSSISSSKPELPVWLDTKIWHEFLKMRSKAKKPPTDYAQKLLLGELEELRAKGHDPNQCIERSIAASWLSFYAPNPAKKGATQNADFIDSVAESAALLGCDSGSFTANFDVRGAEARQPAQPRIASPSNPSLDSDVPRARPGTF